MEDKGGKQFETVHSVTLVAQGLHTSVTPLLANYCNLIFTKHTDPLEQGFSNCGSRPTCGSKSGTRWVAQSHLAAAKFAFQ